MLTATERIFRELHAPAPAKPAPKIADVKPVPPLPINLDWHDVQAIIKKKREATLAELEFLIQNHKQFSLTNWQLDEIRLRMTLAVVSRANPRRSDPTADFIYNTLHAVETPVGLLQNCEWVQREMKAGAEAIANCKYHRPPRCSCWRTGRERLWYIQDGFGARSPEGWAATRLWEAFAEYEQAARSERTEVLSLPSQQLQEQSEL
jgi:hypothetical protein